MTELEKDLDVRDEEIRQFTLQLELSSRESRATEEQLHARATQLQVHLTHTHTTLWKEFNTDVNQSLLLSLMSLMVEWSTHLG